MMVSGIMELLGFTILSSLIGFGFNVMQEPDMVFAKYRDFLNWLCWIKDDNYPLNSSSNKYKKSMFFYYLTKPLGLCVICNTTWIGIITTLILLDIPIGLRIFCSICVGVASAGLVTLIVRKQNE